MSIEEKEENELLKKNDKNEEGFQFRRKILLFKKKEYRKQIKIFQEENNFLKEKCKMLEEKHDELFKENHILSENFMKLNEELELYKSIFLVKNLEIKFKQKKENYSI